MRTSILPLFLLIVSCNSSERVNKRASIDPSISARQNISNSDPKSSAEKSKMAPAKYTVLRKREGLVDVLVKSNYSKENCRWVIAQVLKASEHNCTIDLWINKSAFKEYLQFYDEEDKIYGRADGAQDFRNKMIKDGKDVKQRIQETEEIRTRNVIASYSTGYLTFLVDDSEESF